MPLRTVATALENTLENLSKINFRKFCSRLLDRRAEPRVPRSRVDDQDFMDITDVLVETFTERGALTVTLEILRDIDCNQAADTLEQVVAALPSSTSSSTPLTSAPTSSSTSSCSAPRSRRPHFVDQHMVALVQRVRHINPILDELLQAGIFEQEEYDRIRWVSLMQERNREVLSLLAAAGERAKDFFYQSLSKHDKTLVDDLSGRQ